MNSNNFYPTATSWDLSSVVTWDPIKLLLISLFVGFTSTWNTEKKQNSENFLIELIKLIFQF